MIQHYLVSLTPSTNPYNYYLSSSSFMPAFMLLLAFCYFHNDLKSSWWLLHAISLLLDFFEQGSYQIPPTFHSFFREGRTFDLELPAYHHNTIVILLHVPLD